MKCLIIDPDKKSRLALKKLLEATAQIKELYLCSTPQQALDIAMDNEIDILFADFQKPGSNGIDFIADLPYARPHLVVTSDKKEVAKDAFDHEAVDFLLKPFTNARLMKSIARVMKHNEKRLSNASSFDSLFLKLDGNLEKVSAKDIYLIQANADYMKIYTTKKEYTIYSTFKQVLANLSQKDFMRIHRSYVVRLDRISAIEDSMVKVEKISIPVSNSYRQALLNRLKIL